MMSTGGGRLLFVSLRHLEEFLEDPGAWISLGKRKANECGACHGKLPCGRDNKIFSQVKMRETAYLLPAADVAGVRLCLR